MSDTSHLDALELGLSRERVRLANAKGDAERQLRTVWVAQIEREIARERRFIGLSDALAIEPLSDDELLAELTGDDCQTCAETCETRSFPCDECGHIDEHL